MRVLLAPFILIVLLACFLSATASGRALAATSSSKKKPVPAAQTSAATSPQLDRLIKEFTSLQKDEKRSQRRDLWVDLEQRLMTLAGTSKGESAAKAACHASMAREELGARSFLASDRLEAASGYGVTAAKYAKSAIAPTALYRQARILNDFPARKKEAVAACELLLKRYPGAKEASDAKKLLAGAKRDMGGEASAAGKQNTPASSVSIRNIFWKGKPQRAVITLELDGEVSYEYEFAPADKAKNTPARLYLDIPGALPSQTVQPCLLPKNMTVTRIRTAKSGDGSRITFDCDGLRCFAVRTPENAPQTIQIEVSRKADIKDGIDVSQAGGAPVAAKKAESTSAGGKKAAQPNTLMEQLGLTVKTIMLDAGHGGKDPGAMHAGFVERQFTLSMAKRVGALLQKKGFTVLYTRTGNSFISLQDRPDAANRKKADLFISIHINANNNPEIRGLETYYLDMAKTQNAVTVAARENAVSVKNISDLQVILTDLMLSSKLEESHDLAQRVHNNILKKTRAAKFTCPDHGVRSAPFYVLMGARMPAILVEFGYITNESDAANLRSEKFLQQQAEGLVEGIIEYRAALTKATTR